MIGQPHPQAMQAAWRYGTVHAVDARRWSVDVLDSEGGLVRDVLVMGSRLPEVHSAGRPQWVLYGAAHMQASRYVCFPIPSRLPGTREERAGYRWYDEVGPYRIVVQADDVFEIRRRDEDAAQRVRIEGATGTVRIDTEAGEVVVEPEAVHVRARARASVTTREYGVEATERVTVRTTDLGAEAITVQLTAGGLVRVTAPSVRIEAATIQLAGMVTIGA